MTKKNKIISAIAVMLLLALATTASLNPSLFKGSSGDTPPSAPNVDSLFNQDDNRTPSSNISEVEKIVFSNPNLPKENFTRTLVEEGGMQVPTFTYNANVPVDLRNQSSTSIIFYANQALSFKTLLVSKLPQETAYTSEKTLHTANANGVQEIASTNIGALSPVTLTWNKTCDSTTTCSTLNNRQYFITFEVFFTENNTNKKIRYFIPLELQVPVLGKIIESCSTTANLQGEIICTGTVPEGVTLQNLRLKLKDASNQDVANSEVSCQADTNRKLNCILTAPNTAGTYNIIASSTTPAITAEQVGTVAVVDFNNFIKLSVSPTKIRSGDATNITIDLDENTEFISVTARIQGPNNYNRTVFFRCHESLTAFECPNKIAEKIKTDKIPVTWVSTDTVPGVYSIIAFARTGNEAKDNVYATTQVRVEPGTCDSYFADVTPNDPICEALVYARENGIFLGKIGPNNERIADLRTGLSRAEFFALAARLYQKVNTSNNYSLGMLRNYKDLNDRILNDPNNRYWVEAIILLDGIVEGYGDGTLRPGGQLKLSELAKVAGLATNFIGYYDRNATPWYNDIVNQYSSAGINFNPEANASRGDTVRLIFDTLRLSEQRFFRNSNFESSWQSNEFNSPYFLQDQFNYIDPYTNQVNLGTLDIPADLIEDFLRQQNY